MKRFLIFLGAASLILAAIGGVVVAAGLMPVTATSGHWPITEWFLHFVMKRSVAAHSRRIEAPPLDREFLVVQGAGAYEVGCFSCHGGPGSQPSIAPRMTPRPPDLTEKVDQFSPAELFYIVRHGVKFTGMPAWPSDHRDDEVWAVVAFLKRLPGMERREYLKLSGRELSLADQAAPGAPGDGPAGAAQPPVVVLYRCAACHGLDGHGRGAHPQLAGQRAEYLAAALRAYRNRERHSGIMQPIACSLSDEEMQAAVDYYSALEAFQPAPSQHPAAVDRGQAIAMVGLPKRRMASCIECHGPSDAERQRHYPQLAGQHEHYLVQQLGLFRSGDRAGTDQARVMHKIAKELSDEQIADVAAYFAGSAP